MALQVLTDEQNRLLDMIQIELEKKRIPIAQNHKKGIDGKRTIVMGHRRWYCREFGPSRWNARRPALWNLIKHFGATIPIVYDSVQINENAVCGKHTDKNNVGLSYIVSLGDFTGGDLHIETPEGERVFNCKRAPLVFDGSMIHWNTPHEGNKYSLVFYQIELPTYWAKKRPYPEDWRKDPEYVESRRLEPLANQYQCGAVQSSAPPQL